MGWKWTRVSSSWEILNLTRRGFGIFLKEFRSNFHANNTYIYVCNNWYNKNLQCAFHYRIAICLTEENIDSNNTRLISSNNHVNDANSYAAGRVKNEIYDIRRPDNLFMRPEETVTADYSYLKTRVTMKIVTSISRL